MDYYQCLRSFVFIVENESFSNAAKKLHCGVSAVSKQMNWLEESLNVTLLIRTTRKLTVTPAGQQFYQFTKKFFLDFELLKQNIYSSQNQVAGFIQVSAPHRTGSELLTPLLSDFCSQYPDVNIHLNLNNKLIDLKENQIDIALRTIVVKDANYLYRKVLIPSFHSGIFASKKYLKKMGIPKVPEDIEKHNCLLHIEEKNMYRWTFVNNVAVNISGKFESNNLDALINAAKMHLGLIQVRHSIIEEEIKRGELVEVLSEYIKPPRPIYLCYLNQNPIPKKTQTLLDFLLDGMIKKYHAVAD